MTEYRQCGRWHNALKRTIDVILSFILLLLLSPFLLVVAMAVKLSSPGSVFYCWRVIGAGGRPFTSYKFRSMFQDADAQKARLLEHNEMNGPVFKMTKDPRITRLGHWLRRYSIDELPQLWSVLIGDMSMVGPRPPLVSEYERFNDYQKQKVTIKPGMTCLWQVRGRNDISDFDKWISLDLEYIASQSLFLDFKILLQTVAEVFYGSGK